MSDGGASRPRLLPYGDRALLLELEDTGAVPAWAAALRQQPADVVGAVVPGGRTVLVVAADGVSVSALRSALERVEPSRMEQDGHDSPDEQVVEIAVRYDGPDLAEVAELTGLSPGEVVTAHTGQIWRVAFGGFAPGFAYLLGDDERLRVPRRAESRTTVPAGAVGLADDYSGVYPRESPGGWQLIGTTDRAMWDLDRDPPNLLAPGSQVRFVDAGPAT